MEQLQTLVYVLGAAVIGCVGYTALSVIFWIADLFS